MVAILPYSNANNCNASSPHPKAKDTENNSLPGAKFFICTFYTCHIFISLRGREYMPFWKLSFIGNVM
jgi:hypothetical protein